MENTSEYLDLWEHPRDYAGATYEGYYVVPIGKHRDSDALARSNYRVGVAQLQAIADKYEHTRPEDCERPFLETPCHNHWAVGYVEPVFVRADCEELVRCAEEIACALENYPVLDEKDFSREEDEEAQEVWQGCFNLREKIEMCVEVGLSIFSARHTHYPYDLRERLLRN